jgi:hypothetical protein
MRTPTGTSFASDHRFGVRAVLVPRCLTLWAMADSLDVVAIRVNDIPTVVVGVVARAETRRTIVPSASGKGRGVEGIDGRAVWRGKGKVHRCCGLALLDEEVHAPGWAEAHRALNHGRLDVERAERGLVKPPADRHVTDGDGEVVDERFSHHGA